MSTKMCDASWLSDEQLRLLVAAERLTVLANADRAALEQALSASRNRSSAEGTDDQQRMWYLRALAAATPESRDGALVAHGGLLYLLGTACKRAYEEGC